MIDIFTLELSDRFNSQRSHPDFWIGCNCELLLFSIWGKSVSLTFLGEKWKKGRNKEKKKGVDITCTTSGGQTLYSIPFIPIRAQWNSYGYLHFISAKIEV